MCTIIILICTEGISTDVDASEVRTFIVCGCSCSILEAWQAIGGAIKNDKHSTATGLHYRRHLRTSGVRRPRGISLSRGFWYWAENTSDCLCGKAETNAGSAGNTIAWISNKKDYSLCSDCKTIVETSTPAQLRTGKKFTYSKYQT